ncbi:MAG: hypothetical protein ACREGD_04290 [Candidatus Saccharimonadales bacterium]
MRYLLGLLGVIGLVIVVVILIIRGLSGDGTAKDVKPLSEYAQTSTVVSLNIDGPVDADMVHQSVRITVGRYQAMAEILQGYPGKVTNTISYPNNSDAYGVFLRALDLLNFNTGVKDPNLADPRGYCPSGNLYTLRIQDGGDEIQNYWRTSCKQGTFKGELGKITDLFEAQIPDYSNFIKDVNL